MRFTDVVVRDDNRLLRLKPLGDKKSCLVQNAAADADVIAPLAQLDADSDGIGQGRFRASSNYVDSRCTSAGVTVIVRQKPVCVRT